MAREFISDCPACQRERREQRKHPQFVAVHQTIMQGQRIVGRMISKTFAKRTANALNRHQPNSEGV